MEIEDSILSGQEDPRESHHAEYIDSVNNCPLCGTPLQLAHEFDYLNGTVKEDAHCPACQIRTRRNDFIIH